MSEAYAPTFRGMCAVCGEPQYGFPDGTKLCVNGHDKAEAKPMIVPGDQPTNKEQP